MVPSRTLRPFGEYPNLLGVTPEVRAQFSPVVKLPLRAASASCRVQTAADADASSSESGGRRMVDKYDYVVRDFTGSGPDGVGLVLDDGRRVPQLLPTRPQAVEFAKAQRAALLEGHGGGYDVGRYDEDRRGMYTSELFAASKEEGDEEEGGDEEVAGRRTVHVGIDIGAPVGTEVHAFEDGLIHSAGYNPAVGDYGYVVVVKHFLRGGPEYPSTVYALYGHLGGASFMADNVPGRKVTKGQVICKCDRQGFFPWPTRDSHSCPCTATKWNYSVIAFDASTQVIGQIGDCAENGGWTGSHVHFQLSMTEPASHDMPGR
ncbi:hypothetical protein THAOC_37483, partial [Thalassiosira oceanica]